MHSHDLAFSINIHPLSRPSTPLVLPTSFHCPLIPFKSCSSRRPSPFTLLPTFPLMMAKGFGSPSPSVGKDKYSIVKDSSPCPCGRPGESYASCCARFHRGELLPLTAEDLMRSRYSAYAAHEAEYIMETTHVLNGEYMQSKKKWKKALNKSFEVVFRKLEIEEVIGGAEGDAEGYVNFTAYFDRTGKLKEKSYFVFENNKWLYRSADAEWEQ